MIFSSYWFLLFAAIFMPVFWVLPPLPRKLWLLATCAVFHTHFAGPSGVLPIIVLAVFTYMAGLTRRKAVCVAMIVVCVSALCFYKYTHFFSLKIVGLINPEWGSELNVYTGKIIPSVPPLAISFFVFEFVHYLYDVVKGGASIRNPLNFSLFSIFWPSLVAGPIKRYEQFIPALESGLNAPFRKLVINNLAPGLMQICLGYVKKSIADNLTVYIDTNVNNFGTASASAQYTLVAAIAFRILLDFSGYSDIAIGFARLMGIRLPANFNWPYLATSLREFWQRWHISLSSWIRDYVYIPLGGNRCGPVRQVLNGFIAFGLCGLWHGPDWNFIIWGVYHGIGLAINNSYIRLPWGIGTGLAKALAWAKPVSWLLTMTFVWMGWLLFFYPVGQAWSMFLTIIRLHP
jgi:alginate O-acetyltransferase complex protein AlgI